MQTIFYTRNKTFAISDEQKAQQQIKKYFNCPDDLLAIELNHNDNLSNFFMYKYESKTFDNIEITKKSVIRDLRNKIENKIKKANQSKSAVLAKIIVNLV